MPSITTYSELQQHVAGWLHRRDLTPSIPGFIALAESRMNGELHSRELEAVATLTASSNVSTLDLPDDLLSMRRVLLGDEGRALTYAPPETFARRHQAGLPNYFTVIGSTLHLSPLPDRNYSVEVVYQRRIAALSDTNPTNLILQRYPDAYLYGALATAQPFLQDDARGQVYEALFQRAVASINLPSRHSGSALQVKVA